MGYCLEALLTGDGHQRKTHVCISDAVAVCHWGDVSRCRPTALSDSTT